MQDDSDDFTLATLMGLAALAHGAFLTLFGLVRLL